MVINVLNLAHREDRLLSFAKQAKAEGCEIRIWEGIVHPNVATGISRAFKQIVRDAKQRELPIVCCAEDDLVWSAPGAWQYFLDNIPDYFDMYIGSHYSGLETFDNRIESFRGMTLILIHSRFFDKFLDLPEDINIDYALGFKGEYFVCPKWVALQMPGYSDQLKEYVDYTNKTPEEKLFRGR